MAGNIKFAAYLKDLRIRKGFEKIVDLEKVSKVSSATISRLEDAIQDPTISTIKKLSSPLGVTVQEMMNAAGYLIDEVKESFEAYGVDGDTYKSIKEIPDEKERKTIIRLINMSRADHGLPPIEEF